MSRAFLHHIVERETVGAHGELNTNFIAVVRSLSYPPFAAVTQHNIVFQASLMGRARDAIVEGTFPDLLRTFFRRYFMPREAPSHKTKKRSRSKDGQRGGGLDVKQEHITQPATEEAPKAKGPVYPKWAVDALRSVGVDLLEGEPHATVVDGSGANWEYAA